MSGSTTKLGIPYPTPTDLITNGATAIQALADKVEQLLTSGYTGTWTTFTATPATGWTIGAARYLRYGPIVAIQIDATRAAGAGALTASAAGNLTDTSVASGIPAALYPNSNKYGVFHLPGVAHGSWRISPAGGATITDLYPNAVINEGDTIVLAMNYMIPSS